MQLTAGAEVHFKGTGYQVLYCDDIEVRICEIENRAQRATLTTDEVMQAYLDGQIVAYEHGFAPDEWAENIASSNDLGSLEFADEGERRQVKYRLPYAEFFAQSIVGALEQDDRVKEIAEAQGHATFPSASTARRWASRYREARFNPMALIDRRRKSFRNRGIQS